MIVFRVKEFGIRNAENVKVKLRAMACDEPFGREFRVERLRAERLSRVGYGFRVKKSKSSDVDA